MAKPSSSDSLRDSIQQILSPTANISKDLPPEFVDRLLLFLAGVGATTPVPDHYNTEGFFSDVVSGVLKPLNISSGRLTCLLTVKPAFTVTILFFKNFFPPVWLLRKWKIYVSWSILFMINFWWNLFSGVMSLLAWLLRKMWEIRGKLNFLTLGIYV